MAFARVKMYSQKLGMHVVVNVVIPQNIQAQPDIKVPVLWLLHGAYGNYNDWMRYTSVERYASAYGLALVMPSAENSCYTDMAHGGAYYSFISEELPRTLRLMFNLSEKREENFIAGLSMGGMGSMMIGLANPDKYAAIGCLSSGAVNRGSRLMERAFGDPQSVPGTCKDVYGSADAILREGKPCPRIYHACGSEDPLLPSALETKAFFEAKAGNPFEYTFVEDPGAHTWEFWDVHIRQFIEYLRLPVRYEEFYAKR